MPLPVAPMNQSRVISTVKPLARDDEGQKKLTNILRVLYDGLRVYGKEPEQLENAIKLHHIALSRYEITEIERGIREHIKRSNEFPTPADIVNIIDPPPPKPDWPAYIGIRQKIRENQFITGNQREYLRFCENYVSGKLCDYEERQTAMREIETLETKMLPCS
jgi:hypothetical protein